MGVDWGRVVPTMPRVNQTANVTDWAALKRYREIAQVQLHASLCVSSPNRQPTQSQRLVSRSSHLRTTPLCLSQMVKDRNMKVMMTLFHHSAPKWALENGG